MAMTQEAVKLPVEGWRGWTLGILSVALVQMFPPGCQPLLGQEAVLLPGFQKQGGSRVQKGKGMLLLLQLLLQTLQWRRQLLKVGPDELKPCAHACRCEA